jgi:transcriptional regulator with XRE-family HTH domain
VIQRHELNKCQKCPSKGNADLPNLLTLRRESLGLSQAEIAHAAKAARSQICRIEAGKMGLINVVLMRMLAVLDLKIVLVPVYLAGPVRKYVETQLRMQAQKKTAENKT